MTSYPQLFLQSPEIVLSYFNPTFSFFLDDSNSAKYLPLSTDKRKKKLITKCAQKTFHNWKNH